MSTSASSTLERQNDDVLENLLGKVKSLVSQAQSGEGEEQLELTDWSVRSRQRGVTNDIYDDAEAQRGLLDNTVSAVRPSLIAAPVMLTQRP